MAASRSNLLLPVLLTSLLVVAFSTLQAQDFSVKLDGFGQENMTVFQGRVLMSATVRKEDEAYGNELYSWDGNAEGRLDLMADILPGEASSYPDHLVDIDGVLHFTARRASEQNGNTQRDLYTWDGSTLSGPESLPNTPWQTPVLFRGSYYYAADFGGDIGIELGRSNDAMRTATLVHETLPGSQSGIITYAPVVVSGDYLYWQNNGRTWHRYDGTAVSEVIAPGQQTFSTVAPHEGRLYIRVEYPATGVTEIYVDEAGALRQIFATGGDEEIRFHGGREGAPLFVSIDTQFYLVQGDQLTALPDPILLPHSGNGSTWQTPDEPPLSFAYDGKVVSFFQQEWQTEPSWQVLGLQGFSPYASLAGEENIVTSSFFPYNDIVYGNYLFVGSAAPIRDATTTVSALRIGESNASGGTTDDGSDGGGDDTNTNNPGELEGWILKQPDATAAQWAGLDDRQKIATSLNADLVDLGTNWFWSEKGIYYYLGELPYLYDHTFSTWYYFLPDETGAYYYNFNSQSWIWFSRDGKSSVEL